MRVISTCAAMASGILLWGLVMGSAHAEHETRTSVLQDTGISPLFVVLTALTIVGALAVLAVFAAIVIRWERSDEEKERHSRSHANEPGK